MATNIAANLDIKDIFDFDSIFHPLSRLDSKLLENLERRQFNDDARPVLLNDAVYIQGKDNSRRAVIWEYSLSRKSWSMPISPPQDIKQDNYTFTEYQSKLLLIGGKYNEKEMKVYQFDEDRGWLRMEDIIIPSGDNIQSSQDITVVSDGKLLIISSARDKQFKLLMYDGKQWKQVDGPTCCEGHRRPDMIIHDGTLYLSDYKHDTIYSIPLESLGDNLEKWDTLPDLPHKYMFTNGATNLTTLNSSVLAAVVPSRVGDNSHILALEPCTKSWIELGEINCYTGIYTSPPKIVGLPPGSAENMILLVIGDIKLRRETHVPRYGPVRVPYSTVDNCPAILEVSATVATYDPNDRISLSSLMKFEKCTSYKVLSELEKSHHKREAIMENANFTLSNEYVQKELYPGVESAVQYIENWLKSDAEETLPATWDNFLHIILQEIKLSHFAKGIEKCFDSTIGTVPERTKIEQHCQSPPAKRRKFDGYVEELGMKLRENKERECVAEISQLVISQDPPAKGGKINDDIFHPLIRLDSEWLESRGEPQLHRNTRPVLLHDAIYIQGSDSNNHAVIWKYSLSKRLWLPITPPQDIDRNDYTFTEYQSKLLLIGGRYNQKEMNVYRFDEDSGWLIVEDIIIPSVDNMQSPRDITVVSEGKSLILSWLTDHQFKLLTYDGLQWKEVDGPKSRQGYGRPDVIVHGGTLYLSDSKRDAIHSVPMESLNGGLEAWSTLPDLPNKDMLINGAPNLTIFNSSVLAAVVPSYLRSKSFVLALEPYSNSWIELGEINCYIGNEAFPPKIVGLLPESAGDMKLLVAGHIKRHEENVLIHGLGYVPRATHYFAVLEVSATVTAYNPSERISLRALMIFEKHSPYKVLTELEKSHLKKKMIMEKANFQTAVKQVPTELYPGIESAATCIESWLTSDAEKTLPPTWDKFLHVLHEIKLSKIAGGIKERLASTIIKSLPEETGVEQHKTSIEEVALVRAELDSLSENLADIGSHDNLTLTLINVEKRFKACRDKCHITFKKLGEEKQEHTQIVKHLEHQILEFKQQEGEYLAEVSKSTSQSPSAKKQEIKSDAIGPAIPGVEMCAEATLVVTNSPQSFIWKGYGLKIHVPPGCLPRNIDQCTVRIQASLSGQYEFPDNSFLVSPVFWLKCKPECKFVAPISIEIQHCAKSKGVSKLSFVKAYCSQKSLPYTFGAVAGGNFSSSSSYGMFELDSFSGITIVQEGNGEREYVARLFYMSESISSHYIHLVVTWNTEVHMTVVKEEYLKVRRAFLGPEQRIEFVSEDIKLDIPQRGISSEGWDIIPLTAPVITKLSVDQYKPQRMIPHCELSAKFKTNTRVTPLCYQVKLLGAKEPFNVFTVVPPEVITKIFEVFPGKKVTEKHFLTLNRQLKNYASKWKNIGLQLGFMSGELNNIEVRPTLMSDAPVSWLMSMLEEWVQWAPGDGRGSTTFATLEELKSALSAAGLGAVAHNLII